MSDASVASQEAEAREHLAEVWLDGPRDATRALDAYAAAIRASERERYAALLLKLADLVEDEDFCCSGKAYEASRGYLEHSDRCPVLEARTALAALEEAGSA